MMNLGVVLPEPGYLEAVRRSPSATVSADLRRGQDRAVRGRGCDGEVRRCAGHGDDGQGARRQSTPPAPLAAAKVMEVVNNGRSTRSAPTTGTR